MDAHGTSALMGVLLLSAFMQSRQGTPPGQAQRAKFIEIDVGR